MHYVQEVKTGLDLQNIYNIFIFPPPKKNLGKTKVFWGFKMPKFCISKYKKIYWSWRCGEFVNWSATNHVSYILLFYLLKIKFIHSSPNKLITHTWTSSSFRIGMERTLYFCLNSLERGEDMIFLRMCDGALKCRLRFLLRSEVTNGLNFILTAQDKTRICRLTVKNTLIFSKCTLSMP